MTRLPNAAALTTFYCKKYNTIISTNYLRIAMREMGLKRKKDEFGANYYTEDYAEKLRNYFQYKKKHINLTDNARLIAYFNGDIKEASQARTFYFQANKDFIKIQKSRSKYKTAILKVYFYDNLPKLTPKSES